MQKKLKLKLLFQTLPKRVKKLFASKEKFEFEKPAKCRNRNSSERKIIFKNTLSWLALKKPFWMY